jgi:hypothetical protein
MLISGIWRALSTVLLVSAIGAAHASPAVPAEALRTLPALERVGGGELKFFGFRVYSAVLWRAAADEVSNQILALRMAATTQSGTA